MKYDRKNYDIDSLCPLWTDYQVVKRVPKSSFVLELGCATGYIGEYLNKKLKCRVWGVDKEYNPNSAYERVAVGDLNNWGFGLREKFDVILCMSILEHLIDPIAVLTNLKSKLSPGGKILIALPNIAHWSIRLKLLFGHFDYTHSGIMDNTHLKFFTLKTSKELVKQAGLTLTHFSIDPDNGIPKFHSLFLRLPYGVAFLRWFYNIFPGLFAYQFILEAK